MEDIVWGEYGDLQIVDLSKKYFVRIEDFMMKNYFPRDIISRYIDMSTCRETQELFLEVIRALIFSENSMILVDKETDEIFGMQVSKPMSAYDFRWTIIQFQIRNQTLGRFALLCKCLIETLLKHERGQKAPSNCFHVFFICIDPRVKGQNFKMKFLDCAYKSAQLLKCTILTFIAYSKNDQIRAQRFHMKEQERIYYGLFREPTGEYPFNNIIKTEYYCILYMKDVAPCPKYTDIKLS